MLIIIHGIAAIRKHYIASSIADALSKSETSYEGYDLKLDLDPIEVYKDGVLVYKPGTNPEDSGIDDGVSTLINGTGDVSIEEGKNILLSGREQVIFSKIHTNESLALDCDLPDATEIGSFDWNTFIGKINRPANAVISGSYSKAYIDAISAEYDGDVKIINITRNPSVSFVMTDDDYESLDYSLINNTDLLNEHTIKFEDILSNGSFEFEGNIIPVGEFENYNDIISVFESKQTLNDEGLDTFNTTDVFEALGYEPLDYDTIVSPRS